MSTIGIVIEMLVNEMGYFQSRNFRTTHAILNFEGFIFVYIFTS